MSRSIVVRMRRRAPYETVEPFRMRLHDRRGHALRDALAKWTMSIPDDAWPELPPEIIDRNADIFEALFAVADQAGGDWPHRARVTAVTLVTDKSEDKRSMGIMLLEDLRTVFGDRDHLHTEDILSELLNSMKAPGMTSAVSRSMHAAWRTVLENTRSSPRACGSARSTKKGYAREDLVDVWARYATDAEARDTHSSKRIPTELVGIEIPLRLPILGSQASQRSQGSHWTTDCPTTRTAIPV